MSLIDLNFLEFDETTTFYTIFCIILNGIGCSSWHWVVQSCECVVGPTAILPVYPTAVSRLAVSIWPPSCQLSFMNNPSICKVSKKAVILLTL